jgi:hypothetical protein
LNGAFGGAFVGVFPAPFVGSSVLFLLIEDFLVAGAGCVVASALFLLTGDFLVGTAG